MKLSFSRELNLLNEKNFYFQCEKRKKKFFWCFNFIKITGQHTGVESRKNVQFHFDVYGEKKLFRKDDFVKLSLHFTINFPFLIIIEIKYIGKHVE